MPAQRHEHLWLAVIRAILGLRRDHQLADTEDNEATELLMRADETRIEPEACYQQLQKLFDATPLSLLGNSLAHYLDLNRMGSLVVAMISGTTVKASLKLLQQYPANFFLTEQINELQIEGKNDAIAVRWPKSASPLDDGLYAYILLTIFRYQAGRRFTFSHARLPKSMLPLLQSGCSRTSPCDQLCELVVEKKWCLVTSFHANPVLQQAILKTLVAHQGNTMRERVAACIDSSAQPARLRLPGVAEQLGLSETVVRKQLKLEAVSFSQLLKRAIHDLATHHLLAGDKTQDVAEQLGFSDRRAFDRSYKEFTGITPGQLRQLGNRLRFQRGNHQLNDIVTSLPPLPKTVQSILALDDNAMRLRDVVAIIEQDPIFRAHLMAKASRAVFGRTPDTLEQALSRNLGLANIKNLAVLFAAQQQLSEQSLFHDIEQLTDCMLLSERLAASIAPDENDAVLLFGLLSLLLLFHQDCVFAHRVMNLWQSCEGFDQFRFEVKETLGVCLYGASSIMLLKWGMSGDINRQLWALCELSQENGSEDKHAVLTCHDIAMTQLLQGASQAAPADNLLNSLTDGQRETVVTTLAAWKQR